MAETEPQYTRSADINRRHIAVMKKISVSESPQTSKVVLIGLLILHEAPFWCGMG